MKKSLIKNTIREIKNSKARFFSIMAIIALGCGFYCGIKATAPSMEAMADNYYSRTELMDYRLVSTVGFDKSDVKALRDIDGVTLVEPGYFSDVVSNYNDSAHEVRLIALNDKQNKVTVLDGRLPKHKGEIAVEFGNFSGVSPEIGDIITIAKKTGDNDYSNVLSTFEYKVVGQIRSPLYISYERGNTTVGDGNLDCFMYTAEDSFKSDRYTEVYVKTEYSQDNTMNQEYTDSIEAFKSKIEKLGKAQSKDFKAENIDTAQETLDKKYQEYLDSKNKAEKQFEKALDQIKKGEQEYKDGIEQGKAEITEGERELQKGYDDYNSALEKYKAEIAKAEKELKSSKEQYKKGREEYKKGLEEYKTGLKTYKNSYNTYYNETKPELEENLKTAKDALTEIEEAQKNLDKQISSATSITLPILQLQKSELDGKYVAAKQAVKLIESGIKSAEDELNKADKKLKKGQRKLVASKALIDKAQVEIPAGEKKLKEEKAKGKKQLDDAYELLKTNEKKLNDAKALLEQNEKDGAVKIKNAKNDYEKNRLKVEKKLKKGEKTLEKAQADLDKIGSPKWYVFTRQDNPGYSAFSDNTGRVNSVAAIFPVFFLLVAVLVCLTTMTRLVDEKRTEIGTFKALGYSNSAIVAKFLVYSTSAGLVGAGLGIILGVNVLPYIIYNAYKMMYSMDEISVVSEPVSVVMSLVIALLCTSAVTAVACYKTLHNQPARLMRPKGPKSGKRILLERITPLWNKFGFTSKVTARNIFRYKSRMFMTVLGVAGCTALIVAAFGLKDSLDAIAQVQFEDIYRYNTIVVAEGGSTSGQLNDLNREIASQPNVKFNMPTAFTDAKISFKGSELDDDINVFVPKTPENLSQIINLRTRADHSSLKLSDDGIIISEKLSVLLGIKVGDRVSLKIDDKVQSFIITGISEQYVGHYAYMTPSLYEKLYGKPEFISNLVYVDGDEAVQSDFGNAMLSRDDVIAVSFMESAVVEFNDMLNSMNMVVFIMIFCAGALAFVVLYNLTNINIAERVREIATIKVLGFDNKETSSFIYRENIVLLILGIVLGLLMGTFLCSWIVTTVELDTVMFGRDVNITSYLLAALLTVLFALAVNFIMYFKMRKINMVESLKSVE